MNDLTKKVDVYEVEESIQLLHQYVTDDSIQPVISVLEKLKKTPDDESLIVQLADTLNSIGATQGAALTYAPYISVLISTGLFDDD